MRIDKNIYKDKTTSIYIDIDKNKFENYYRHKPVINMFDIKDCVIYQGIEYIVDKRFVHKQTGEPLYNLKNETLGSRRFNIAEPDCQLIQKNKVQSSEKNISDVNIKSMKIVDLFEQLNERHKNNYYRRITCHYDEGGNKTYKFGERNNMSLGDIQTDKGTGNTLSLYVKYIPDLYVIDFDTKQLSGCKLKELLDSHNTLCVETYKGYHYYIYIQDMIEYTNQQRVYINDEFDMDLIKKNNIWERDNRVSNGTIDNIPCFEWNILSQYFQVDKMNVKKSPPITPVQSADETESNTNDDDDEWGVIKPEKPGFSERDYEKVKLAILKLDKQRSDNYSDWLNVGMALYNNGDNLNNKTLKIWEEFSKQDPDKYEEMACYNKWMTFTPQDNGLTIASIFHWLKLDNPEEHKIITKTSTNRYEEWFLQGEECLIENMNLELMHTKKNEYIQLDHDTHFMYCKKDLVDEYAKYTFTVYNTDGKVTTSTTYNPFNVWLKNINRRDIIGLKFDPSMKQDPLYFNLYKGFQYQLTDDTDYTDIEAYLFHIHDVWANGDSEVSEYILNWFAHIYQKPYKRTDVAIVIPSETEGNGKNIAMNVHSKIMDKMYYSTADINSIVGNFNPQAEGRLLINLNECTWAGRKSQTGILKALVTENTMTINQKNIKSYLIDNYSNVIIFSNDENPIEIGKNNRRYYVLDIKEQKMDSRLIDGVLNVDPQKLFNYFMNRDISDFDPTKFKTTKREQGIKEFSLGSEFDFWLQALTENWFTGEGCCDYSWDELSKVNYTLPKSELFSAYSKQSYGYKPKLNNVHFIRQIKKIFPDIKLMSANRLNPPRIRLYELDRMKRHFNQFYKNEYFTFEENEVSK